MSLLRRLTPEQKRSVRHWGMEFFVVLTGVLLALWLQEWGERRRALSDMRVAEAAIHDEVRSALETLMWREAISDCHLQRLQQLKDMLLKSGSAWPGISESAVLQTSVGEATGIETVVPSVYDRPGDPIKTAAWTSALTTGALAPMKHDRFARLTGLYHTIYLLNDNWQRENRGVSTLAALAFPQELTPESRTRMFAALHEVDSSRFVFNYLGASNLASRMRELGWTDKAQVDE